MSRLDVLNDKMFTYSFMKFYFQQKIIHQKSWFFW